MADPWMEGPPLLRSDQRYWTLDSDSNRQGGWANLACEPGYADPIRELLNIEMTQHLVRSDLRVACAVVQGNAPVGVPGQDESGMSLPLRFDACEAIEMSDVILRDGLTPTVDPGELRRTFEPRQI